MTLPSEWPACVAVSSEPLSTRATGFSGLYWECGLLAPVLRARFSGESNKFRVMLHENFANTGARRDDRRTGVEFTKKRRSNLKPQIDAGYWDERLFGASASRLNDMQKARTADVRPSTGSG